MTASVSSHPCLRALKTAAGFGGEQCAPVTFRDTWSSMWPSGDVLLGMLEHSGHLIPGLLFRDLEEVANGINVAFSLQQIRLFCLYV